MTYEEWLSTIEQLNTPNTNQDLLNKLKQEPVNNNQNNDLFKIKSLQQHQSAHLVLCGFLQF